MNDLNKILIRLLNVGFNNIQMDTLRLKMWQFYAPKSLYFIYHTTV